MDENICGTSINVFTFETALRKYFGNCCPNLESLKAEQIAVGEGFTSKIVRVYLKWKNGQENLPESVIFKAPSADALDSLFRMFSSGTDQNYDAMVKMIVSAHEVETSAYTILGPLNILPMPKCFAAEKYHGTTPGFLILEDLGPKAIIAEKNELPMTLGQISNVVDLMTNLHIWSLNTDIDLSKHFLTAEDDKENIKLLLESFKQGILSMKAKYPLDLKEIDEEKITKFLHVDNYIKVFDNHVGLMPSVIVHGDFWSNNVMFERIAPNGKASGRVFAIIDWQVCSLGSCMVDFGRLLSEFPESFLNAHIDNILQKYCNVMSAKAGQKFNLSFDQVKSMFETHLGINALQFISMANVGESAESDRKRKVEMAQEKYRMAMKFLKL